MAKIAQSNAARMYGLCAGLFLLAALHGVFAWMSRGLRPELGILDPPPAALAREAASLGDHQFLYRLWALDLQNAGDTSGRATPMRLYNYDNVTGWLAALRALDPLSDLHLALAIHFSQTTDQANIRRMIDFVADDVDQSPRRKWVRLVEVVEIAEGRLKDTELALALCGRLSRYVVPEIPFGISALSAVYLEKLERYDEARRSIEGVADKYTEKMTVEEKAWTQSFIQRLPKP